MQLLDGKQVAESVLEEVRQKVLRLEESLKRKPNLVVVLVGSDPASQVYVRNKHRTCERVGMSSEVIHLPADTTEAHLRTVLRNLNDNEDVDGILVQLPLPAHLASEIVLEEVSADKDADGMTYFSTGLLWSGRKRVSPCTPQGVMRILQYYGVSLKGKEAVVVGRSQIVGKPMAALLLEAGATVTICHRDTLDLSFHTRRADIVVVAAGKPRFLGREDFKKNSVVIDVGIHGTGSGKLCGDVRFEELDGHVSSVTPVPGGVGPMTIACLMSNTMHLAELRRRKGGGS